MSQSQFVSHCTADALREAARSLLAGNLVAFPTETVYGLGADACNAEAVARIYSVKGDPMAYLLPNKSVPLHQHCKHLHLIHRQFQLEKLLNFQQEGFLQPHAMHLRCNAIQIEIGSLTNSLTFLRNN